MQKSSKIYVAGHRGLVGGSIVRSLKEKGYTNIITRTHSELDLLNQAAVNEFFATEKPEYVFLAAAHVGGIGANSTYPADFIYQNMVIGFNVVEAARVNGVKKLMNLGSTCIYPKMAERTITEFNWTLSSFSIQFFIKKFNLENCTYLDADTYFYNNPKLIYDELLPSESVLITPHNYASKYDQSNTSGRYCVQFMYFKNDENGNKVLEWWRNECEKFCNSSFKDGKFGDQKYLDDWLSRFPNIVHESKSLGIGVAPWNICRFNLFQKEDFFFIQDKITKLEYPVIFYHFHGLKEFYDKNNEKWWDYNFSYELSEDVQELFYEKYTKELTLKESICPSFTKRKLPKINYFYVIKISIKKSIKMFIKFLLVIKTFNQEKKSQIKHFVKD